jgi:ABC-type branched-subunit amino acid transport system ATPase component
MRYTYRALTDLIAEIRRGGSIILIEHVVHAFVTSIDPLLVFHNGVFPADGDPQTVTRSAAVAENLFGNRKRCLNRC